MLRKDASISIVLPLSNSMVISKYQIVLLHDTLRICEDTAANDRCLWVRNTDAHMPAAVGNGTSEHTRPPSSAHPHAARVVFNRRITAHDHFQDVRHVRLDISGAGIAYGAGDVVNLLPSNAPEAVDELLSILCLSGDVLVAMETTSNSDVSAKQCVPGGASQSRSSMCMSQMGDGEC